MGREQELIQAVKNGDVPGVQKLVAKIKASKSTQAVTVPGDSTGHVPERGWRQHWLLGSELRKGIRKVFLTV
ncbi:hypothetical protein DV515_00009950 [Chloebia gouldiae]|uniref:Uncharacterized protein n=1 Tax=Chloebia gouldiae TaxID=44316 RepID=A0A3L8SB14_CHLGU|nr:hypothetical protein DV515_00009950 [Chloebia gouldiae]